MPVSVVFAKQGYANELGLIHLGKNLGVVRGQFWLYDVAMLWDGRIARIAVAGYPV
jgi:hypothetical protein